MVTKSCHALFDLDQIQAVRFRCGECRTVLSFPRIRWANFPENCPNCSAKWMHRPGAENLVEEDPATSAFRAIRSFREALQALIGLGNRAGFSIGLEIEEVLEDLESQPEDTGSVQKVRT